jgi:hypothetical protein
MLSFRPEFSPRKMEKDLVNEKWRKIWYILSKICRYLENELRRP